MSRAAPRFKRANAPLPVLTTPAYRITQFYLVDQQICLFNMDYVMAGVGQTNASEQNLATNFFNATNVALKNVLAADATLTNTKCQCLTTPSRMPFTLAGSNPGNVAGNHIPSEMAVVVTKQTFTKGQHGRGRLYFPGIPSSFVTPATDANRLNATGSGAFVAVLTALLSNAIVDGANQASGAVTQRVTKGLPVTNGQSINLLVGRTLLGVIRRRRIGRGK